MANARIVVIALVKSAFRLFLSPEDSGSVTGSVSKVTNPGHATVLGA